MQPCESSAKHNDITLKTEQLRRKGGVVMVEAMSGGDDGCGLCDAVECGGGRRMRAN